MVNFVMSEQSLSQDIKMKVEMLRRIEVKEELKKRALVRKLKTNLHSSTNLQ